MVQWVKNDCSAVGCCGGMGWIPSPVQQFKGSSIDATVAWVMAEAQIQSLAGELPYATELARKWEKKNLPVKY